MDFLFLFLPAALVAAGYLLPEPAVRPRTLANLLPRAENEPCCADC